MNRRSPRAPWRPDNGFYLAYAPPNTGTVHIAAALGTPVVGIYGPTRPWRVGPYDQPDGIVYHGDRCGAGCRAYCVRSRWCLPAAHPR